MVGKHARNFLDVFFLRRHDPAVSGDHAIVAVDDDRIDKSKFTQRGAEFIDLFRGVGTRIIDIRHQFLDWNKLHFCRCLHRTSPHSANFSKPPMDLI